MHYEKKYLYLVLGVALLLFFLEFLVGFDFLELDLSILMPAALIAFTLGAAIIYMRTGDIAFFFVAGVLSVVTVINLWDIAGGWNQLLITSAGLILGAVLIILRLTHKVLPVTSSPK